MYAGMNSNDPMRNIARCENRPRGGLQILLAISIDRNVDHNYPMFLYKIHISLNSDRRNGQRTDKDKIGRQFEPVTSKQLKIE